MPAATVGSSVQHDAGRTDRSSRWRARWALSFGLRALASGRGAPVVAPGLAIAAVVAWPALAEAAPVIGVGEAKGSEWKNPPDASVVRKRALRRARTKAIAAELDQRRGVDKAARKDVMGSHSSWTSAYRIVRETRSGDAIRIQIEVDVDLQRLAKRVSASGATSTGTKPRFALGTVKASASGNCGDPQVLQQRVAEELAAVGAITTTAEPGAAPVDLLVTCERLGAVRYTHMHAAKVEITAATDAHAVAAVTRESFGEDDDAAVEAGLSQALFSVGARLAEHQRGRITVKIEASGPGDRVRRLERAIRDKVMGVRNVEVSGLQPGTIALSLTTDLAVAKLAKRLSALSLPDFSVTILATEEPDVVTIRLH